MTGLRLLAPSGRGFVVAIASMIAMATPVDRVAANPSPLTSKVVNALEQLHSSTVLVEPKICATDLPVAIATVINRPQFNSAHWGVLIEPLTESTPLYHHNSDTSLIPASNIKLLTTAAALRIVENRAPQGLTVLESWLTVVNRDSHNRTADELLRRIGGQQAVRQVLAPLGVNPNDYQQVDGSGLSRQNRAKPSTFVTLLKSMYANDNSGLFYHSLPIAGISGTLRNRFRDTPVQGRVYAKTGTLQGVRALSGYLENEDYGIITFSIMVNQSGQSGQTLVQALDQIVLQTAQVARCD
jgi:D-alanyl-D-alanine carboxypeptidase/D-alanyl-D-alanine-endopeptidase (penicillin-binding protein 4)